MNAPICPYCQKAAELVTGDVAYPNRPDLKKSFYWRCEPCDAHVICKPHTTVAQGRLCNAELRQAKNDAHNTFDPYWRDRDRTKDQKRRAKERAYAWLANKFGIPFTECNIALFDLEQCRRIVELCKTEKIPNFANEESV